MASKTELRSRWNYEPGSSIIRQMWSLCHRPPVEHGFDSSVLIGLLDGLPFRNEVENGRDLRGAKFGANDLDLQEWDFSYAQLGDFFRCNLTRACFYAAEGRSINLASSILDEASFQNSKLRSCYLANAKARKCQFDRAMLRGANFEYANVSGSCFRHSSCVGVKFLGADLRGCDFQNAVLDRVVFQEAKIDKTTDFRGASLTNVYYEDVYNREGGCIARGVDLRAAIFDDKTVFKSDPRIIGIEILESALKVAEAMSADAAKRILAVLKEQKKKMAVAYSENWGSEILEKLDEQERVLFNRIIEEAYRNLS